MTERVEFANANVCPGCGDEYDPRDAYRSDVTESGYCGLMCALDAADREQTENEEVAD